MKIKKSLLIIPAVLLSLGITVFNNQTMNTHAKSNHTKTYQVSNLKQLRTDLKRSGHKKIILTKSLNQPNRKNKYVQHTGYSFNKYLRNPNGSQAKDIKKAENKQKKDVEVKVPSNTEITAKSPKQVKGINFVTNGNHIRFNNLKMSSPVDDFPIWDAKDGKTGNWNSLYDAISIKSSKYVTVSNSSFTDSPHLDKPASIKTFNRPYQQHDGLVDITNGANHIIVNHNRFANHDKTMLIGNSDSRTSDKGKLNTKVTNNTFINCGQRIPRVRFGHVIINHNKVISNNRNPYPLVAVYECGKDATMMGKDNSIYIKNIKHKDLFKKVVTSKGGKKLNLKQTKINGKKYNIKLNHNHIRYQKIK